MAAFSLCTRMIAVQSPIIPVIGELIRTHPGTVSLGQGVAWYGPLESTRAKILNFFDEPSHHQYGPIQGIPPLLDLIECKLVVENGIHLAGRKVVVTAGANIGFLNALFAITDPGDEVISYFFCNLKELSTTETELIAMAAEAIIGFSLPMAATGMATML
jgi:aspartate/methionine/tyrosine aminotransferase